MPSEQRYRQMDAVRVRAELTVQDLWLRYLALGGTGDTFDLDGYLQGVVPLEAFQQDVLAQALNEALKDTYLAHRIQTRTTVAGELGDDEPLPSLIEELLNHRSTPPTEPRPPGGHEPP